WEVQNGNADEPGYNVRGDNPLVYDGLYQTGSYAIGGKAYLTAVRGLSLSADGPFAAYLENGKIGKPGTALWISALMRKDNMTDSSLAIGTDWPSTKLETGFFGSESTDNNIRYWSLKVNGTVYRSAVPLEVGKAALLVMKLELGAENRISLYVNPAEPGGDAPAAPDVQAATDANLGFGMISTTSASGGTEDYSIDEIRIGTTFGAVTPAFFDNEAP
ncbi:hypothetical protein K0U00_44930, partial [Paenibacillus sepulcri]|nr:hypothetical protein [Paenibacillus sepulcri]